mgnify:CR=1 FL=1
MTITNRERIRFVVEIFKGLVREPILAPLLTIYVVLWIATTLDRAYEQGWSALKPWPDAEQVKSFLALVDEDAGRASQQRADDWINQMWIDDRK